MVDWIKPGMRVSCGTQGGGVVEAEFGSRPGDNDPSLKGWYWIKLDSGGIALKSPAMLQKEGEKKPAAKPSPFASAKPAAGTATTSSTRKVADAFAPRYDAGGRTLRAGLRIRLNSGGCGLIQAAYGDKPGDEDKTLRELGMWWVAMDTGNIMLKLGTDMRQITDTQGSGKPGGLTRGECPCGGKLKPRVKEGFKVKCSGCSKVNLEQSEHGYWFCPSKTCDYAACTSCCKGPSMAQKRKTSGALIVSKRGKTAEDELREQEAQKNKGSGWVQYYDGKTMRQYFHNAESGETTWVPPAIPNIASGENDPNP
eukprot:Hpha_TRINITY_DN15460_c2_g1::TRINITY_DN15460_c2_g1_i1::g.176455::m.176455